MPVRDKDEIFRSQLLGRWADLPEPPKGMQVDFVARVTGRTKACVECAKHDKNLIIIVPSMRHRTEILKKFDIDPGRVMTIDFAQDRAVLRDMPKEMEFWIDEAQDLIQSQFKRRVAGISGIGEIVGEGDEKE